MQNTLEKYLTVQTIELVRASCAAAAPNTPHPIIPALEPGTKSGLSVGCEIPSARRLLVTCICSQWCKSLLAVNSAPAFHQYQHSINIHVKWVGSGSGHLLRVTRVSVSQSKNVGDARGSLAQRLKRSIRTMAALVMIVSFKVRCTGTWRVVAFYVQVLN